MKGLADYTQMPQKSAPMLSHHIKASNDENETENYPNTVPCGGGLRVVSKEITN